MIGALRAKLAVVLRLGALYGMACLLGLVLLLGAFTTGLFGAIGILFYRGLILVALVFVATFAGLALALAWRRPTGLAVRDAFAAAVFSFALNLCFLVLVPVTVDRSISIFVLAQMAGHADRAYTPDEMSALFTRVYVDDLQQIDRRLDEQAISGNVVKVGNGYQITRRGKALVDTAMAVAWLFGTRRDLLTSVTDRSPARH